MQPICSSLSSRDRDGLQNFLYHITGCAAGEPGLGIQHQSMGHHRDGDFTDMFRNHKFMAIHYCEGLGGLHEGQGSAGTGPERHPLGTSGSSDNVNNIALEFSADAYISRPGFEGQNFSPGHAGPDRLQRVLFDLIGQDGDFLFRRHIPEVELEGETIHLGLGQGIGTARLDGILGGNNKKQVLQKTHLAVHADLVFGHGLQQCGLRPRRGPVDFVRQEDIAEYRSFVKVELFVFFVVNGHPEDVGRQQVRGELDAPEAYIDGTGQGLGQGGLPGTGRILKQNMAAAEKSRHQFAQGRRLPAHHLPDVVYNPFNRFCRTGCIRLSHGSPRGPCRIGSVVGACLACSCIQA